MAGAGFKDFTVGQILTSQEVDEYLQQQCVMRFATTAARDSAIAAPSEGMQVYIDDRNSLMFYDGSAWLDTVLQSRTHGVRASRASGDLTINNVSITAIAFTSEAEDTDGYHDNSTNNTRFTVPTGLGGLYSMFATARWGNTAPNVPVIAIRKNGNDLLARVSCPGTAFATMSLSICAQLAANDYVEVVVYHDSGGSRTISFISSTSSIDARTPEFSMYLVGAPNA